MRAGPPLPSRAVVTQCSCDEVLSRRGDCPAHPQAGRSGSHHHASHRRAWAGARRGQGSAQDDLKVRRTRRALLRHRCPAPSRPHSRHPHPGRLDRPIRPMLSPPTTTSISRPPSSLRLPSASPRTRTTAPTPNTCSFSAPLNALARGRHDPTLIRTSYTLRALALAGWAPSCFDCAVCGTQGPHTSFSIPDGGTVCDTCRPPGASSPAPDTVALLGQLLSGDWERADRCEPLRARRGLGSHLLVHSMASGTSPALAERHR